MRLVDAAEALATFPPVYEQMRAVTPGALSRTEDWWRWAILHDAEHMRHGAGPKFRYLYEVDGAAEGYATYRAKTDWDERGPRGQLLVVEAMALTPRAERAVWGFLFGVDLMRTTKAIRVPVPHPLQLELADPRALGMTVGDGIWVRLVDLPAAYLGAFRPSELARAGRVEERTPGALRRADALFASDRAPWCVTMF
jgi:predicted acetyltransferase